MLSLVQIAAEMTLLIAVILGCYALLFKLKPGSRYEACCRIVMAGLTALLVAKLVASIYQPEVSRPFEMLGVDPGASFMSNPGFPSDHVLLASAILLAVWFESRARVVAAIIAAAIVAMAFGRVFALVHTPLDVMFGFVFACFGALWYMQPRISTAEK